MQRLTSVFLSVLLGAFSVGIAIVPFYVLANKDRHSLASNLETVKARAENAEAEKQRLANEANARVKEANAEVERAQGIVASLKEEQKLLDSAKRLIKPGSRELALWTTVVSIPQHTSLSIPKTSAIESDTGNGLRIMTAPTTTDPYARGAVWLEVLPYDELQEQELLASIASSTDVAFVANGRLLAGKKGISIESGMPALVLVFRDGGEKTRLLSLREIPALGKNGAERILSTVAFE